MKKKFYMLFAVLTTVLSGILLINVFSGSAQAALPRDCDDNSIINCGAVDPNELKTKYNQDQTGDLKTIYSHYGVSAEMITAGAVNGEVHKDGRVTVNGKTVATGSTSIGRQNIFSGSTKINIGGRDYYETPNDRAFRSESIAAFVFLDQNGEFIAAILTSCGNPVRGVKVPKPVYKCGSLKADKISSAAYKFTAAATAQNASIVGYRYDFGDGKSESSQANTISHAYAQSGEYVAKVIVDVKVGDEVKQVTGEGCQVKVTIAPEAAYSCDSLSARLIKKEDRSYAFDLKYTTSGDAKLKTVDFAFGDGQGREGVAPDQLDGVSHSYAKTGNYTAKATLHFQTGDEGAAVKSDECQVSIEIGQEVCPHNPSLPIGDARCAPPVQELPKTGPMDMISGGLGIGSLVAATGYWYASRRGLLDAWMSR